MCSFHVNYNCALNESVLTCFHCTHVIADTINSRIGLEDLPIKMNSVEFLGDIYSMTYTFTMIEFVEVCTALGVCALHHTVWTFIGAE